MLLSDQSTLVMESPQIIYQQPQQQHGEVQTQYIIQEEELQPDAFNGQPTQQVRETFCLSPVKIYINDFLSF